MIRMLKLPVVAATLWFIWKFVAVDVIVRVAATQGEVVPAWFPITAIVPAPDAEAFVNEAVIVGRPVSDPDTHTMKLPKFGKLRIFVAVFVIAIG